MNLKKILKRAPRNGAEGAPKVLPAKYGWSNSFTGSSRVLERRTPWGTRREKVEGLLQGAFISHGRLATPTV